MDIGIQLSMKVGEVLVNVYEPDRTKLEEAVSDLKLLHTKMSVCFPPKEEVPFVTNPARETIARDKSFENPCLATTAGGGFCKGCGKAKKWIQFKEPRPNQFNPSEMQVGFWGCPDNCQKK